MNETICPGLNEALDIAPRATVKVEDHIKSSFEHEGFGYFAGIEGIVYQVNLTNMRLMNQSRLSYGGLWTGFASGGYGYVGGGGGIVKFVLKTLAKVKSVKVQDDFTSGFASGGYGYFTSGSNPTDVYQVDLTTMEIKNHIKIDDQLLASTLGDGYGFFGGSKQIIYKVDLKTLNYTQSEPLGEVLLSACCGGQVWGTGSGKIFYFDKDPMGSKLNEVIINKGWIAALTRQFFGILDMPAQVGTWATIGDHHELSLNGVDVILTGFQIENTAYFGSQNGYIIKIETTGSKDTLKPIYPTMGDPIGLIHQTNPLDFPQEDDKSSFFSLFSTDTEFKMNNTTKIEYLYQSMHVHNFNDEPCKTSQPNYLCRRINLAPTQLHITKDYKYSIYVMISLCATVTSTMFAILRQVTKRAPQVYNTIFKRKTRRESNIELEYTQM
eukprot:g5265.t1